MSTANPDTDLPALLGGTPLFGAVESPWPPSDPAIEQVLQQMSQDGSWGRYFGPHCERLAERLQEHYACEHVLLCSSGRAAVELAMRGLRVEPGNEVALSAYDFHSNFAGIHQVGATPLLCDVQPTDAQLDVAGVDAGLAGNTVAIIASHLQGGVVDMPALRGLADERGLAIVEDACQASGAMIAGRPAGMWGDVGVLSFGGSKLLTAGRGGALLTNRSDVMQRIRRYLRGDNHAYPLSEMQAAVLLPQLVQLADRHQRRQEAVGNIDEVVAKISGLVCFASPAIDASPAYYKVGMFYDPDAFDGLPRERFVEALRTEGLTIDVGFPALQTIHSPRRFRADGELTAASCAGEHVVGLHHPILLAADVDWSLLEAAVDRVRRHAAEMRSS